MRLAAMALISAALAAFAPSSARAQQPDSQHAVPKLPPPPDTIRAGMRVRLHVTTTTLIGTILTLDRDSLILQETKNEQPVQTSIPLVCLTGAERGLPEKAVKKAAIKGFMVGAVVGLAAGIIVNNQRGASQPATPPFYLLAWSLGGGGVGAGTAALIADRGKKWEPASLPLAPGVSFELRTELCKRWTSPQ